VGAHSLQGAKLATDRCAHLFLEHLLELREVRVRPAPEVELRPAPAPPRRCLLCPLRAQPVVRAARRRVAQNLEGVADLDELGLRLLLAVRVLVRVC